MYVRKDGGTILRQFLRGKSKVFLDGRTGMRKAVGAIRPQPECVNHAGHRHGNLGYMFLQCELVLQIGLRLFALVDVLNCGHRADRLAGGIPHDGHVHVHPHQRAILANVAFLQAVIRCLAPDNPLEGIPIPLPVFGMCDLRDTHL